MMQREKLNCELLAKSKMKSEQKRKEVGWRAKLNEIEKSRETPTTQRQAVDWKVRWAVDLSAAAKPQINNCS